mgnify:CR=1 FL=1
MSTTADPALEAVDMIDFDAIDAPPITTATSVEVVDEVTVTVLPSQGRSDLVAADPASWDWQQLQDYVIAQIEQHTGPFPRKHDSEIGIFKGFVKRWGNQAGPIAVAAFEVHGGRWRGAPIAATRFCKNSDPYFADVIAKNLTEGSIQGW